MIRSILARRYAAAYFELAKQANQVAEWGKELRRAQETMDDARLADTMRNPKVRVPDRVRLAMELLDGVSQPAKNLVRLLIERGRVQLLDGVVEEYVDLAVRDSGVVRALVQSARPLNQTEQDEVKQTIGARLGSGDKVELQLETKPELIGGLVIRIDDRIIDNSVRTHLQQLQAAMA